MAEEVIIKVKTDVANAEQGLEKVKQTTEETSDAAKDAAGNFQVMGVSLNSVKGAFAKIIPTAKAMFGSIKAGLISTGIGAFVIAIGSLVSYFTNTKRGAEQLQRIFAGFGAAVSVLTDRFSAVGETIVGAFTNPKEAVIGLWNTIKENLINRIEGTIDQFKAFGKIIKSAIDLDFDGVKEGAEDFASATLQVATGMDEVQRKNFANTIKDITTEIKNETTAAVELAGALQKIKDAEREFSIQKAQTAQEIQKARFEALDENKTLEERLEALQKASDLEIATTEKAIQLQKEKLEAKKAEVDLGESLEEDFDELAQLEVELINLQTQSFQTRKRIATEIETLTREQMALDKQKTKEDEDAVNKLNDLRKQIALELQTQEEQEITKATEKYDKLIELAEQNGLDTIELERKKAETISEIKRKAGETDEATQKAVDDAQVGMATQSLGQIKGLFGEQSAAGKAAGIIDATINTYVGASKAIAQGGVIGPILAATTIASGLATVGKIAGLPAPEFAQGGIVGGFGTGTSDSVTAKLSKGESVINEKSTRMFKPLLSTINEAGGGRAFAGNEGSGGQSVGVVKAFVVADDMTNEQDKLTKIRRKATI